jgi:NAD(P)-dependent dehydrogenase (short-subunit alcohol dehydrogenase family)
MTSRRNLFARRIALVAGGTGGLGRAVSLAFLENGANVVATYRSPGDFARLVTAAGESAARLEGRSVDVTVEPAARELVESVVGRHGRLDALVNTVGGYGGGRLWEQDAELLDRMLDLNLRSGFVLARAAVPAMLRQRNGAIVNVASKAAVDHGAGVASYAASKAAALAMMDSLASDLKGTGVRVNTILPSVIDTDANRKAMPAANFGTWPKPDEIARVVLFLCSDDATVVHGAAIPVYGNL